MQKSSPMSNFCYPVPSFVYFVICFHSVERVRALAMPNGGTQDFHLGDAGMVKLRSQKIK